MFNELTIRACTVLFFFLCLASAIDSAFGIMLWEMLSGKIPFLKPGEEPDPTPTQLLIRIAGGERPDLNDVSDARPDLIELMKMCWAQEVSDRPSMRQVLDTLAGRDPVAIFKRIDTSNDNKLGYDEFVTFLMQYAPGQVHPSEMYGVFLAIDSDGSNDISLDEFQEFWQVVDSCGLKKALANYKDRSAIQDVGVQQWFQS